MDISKKIFIVATHELVYGAPQALRDYLELQNAERVVYISHPLLDAKCESYVESRNGGGQRKSCSFKRGCRYAMLNYILHIWCTLLWSIRYGDRSDIYIGANPLNAFAGVILRSLGRVKKVVYYTIDFTPKRFNSRVINSLYHLLDKKCVSWVDEVWNVSPLIYRGRENLHGANSPIRDKQFVVPIGVWFDKVMRLPLGKINRYQLLFVGHLLEKQGVQLVIEAMPSIISRIPDFEFIIIGGGEYEPVLKSMALKKGVSKHIKFAGWIKDRNQLDCIMANSAIAVATYCQEIASYTAFADPTKIKDYLSAGLPIVMTDVSFNAKELEANGCAKVVDASKEAIANAVVELMTNQTLLENMRHSAIEYIKEFEWSKIFSKNLSRLVDKQ